MFLSKITKLFQPRKPVRYSSLSKLTPDPFYKNITQNFMKKIFLLIFIILFSTGIAKAQHDFLSVGIKLATLLVKAAA